MKERENDYWMLRDYVVDDHVFWHCSLCDGDNLDKLHFAGNRH